MFKSQKEFFDSGKTLSLDFRLAKLKRLKSAIFTYEPEILQALKSDLNKPLMESYTTELLVINNEINLAIKNLKNWAKPQKVRPTLLTFPSKSYIYSEPYGLSLIISPWNYPFQLALVPLVGAIAAGNCCTIKPSEHSPASTKVLKQIIDYTFDQEYIALIEGEVETSTLLLEQPFDKVFFTGSPEVGKIVMEKAAKHLSSVTLELGGKSPCIVDKNVDLDIVVKRILWAKFMNAGQTCIAPDYLLVHKSIKRQFYLALKKWLLVFFSKKPQTSPDYGRIMNARHFQRLQSYIGEGKTIVGGGSDEAELFIEPTIIEIEDLEAAIMREEIFGPILPVIVYEKPSEIKAVIARNPNPLSFYIFSQDKQFVSRMIESVPFGGGCVNDTINHFMNHNLPFGGRGTSGVGNYHGRHSFEAFSHKKSVLHSSYKFDLKLKYPPYKNMPTLIRKFLLR